MRQVVAWLPAARWTTSALLWLAFAVAWLFPSLDLPLRALTAIGLTAAFCRTWVAAAASRNLEAPEAWLGAAFTADTLLLTGLLDLTGGPYNPFVVMYLVYAWAAAVVASPRWGVLVATISLLGFAWLVFDHLQAERVEHHRLNDFPTHLFTMWVSAAAVLEVVVHYVRRADAVLAERQQLLDAARARAAQSEHLASLTTLAAGAAHELSTPLGTIAVVARELQRSVDRPTIDLEGLRDDARLIRTEVERCQVILDGMTGRAREAGPRALDPLPPTMLVALAEGRLNEAQRRRLRVEISDDAAVPSGAGAEIAQAVASLLKNAFDASGEDDDVRLRFTRRDGLARIEVHDAGSGMSTEVLRRAGEPFYTTKEPGRGLGLGLFLVRTFAERAGGSLRFEVGTGTTAILEVPEAGGGAR
jgi:two-component system sensor histidine kinase RegB